MKSSLRIVGRSALAAASICAALVVNASCIRPGDEIIGLVDGFKWCANAEGAQAWNSPGNKQDLLDGNGQVIQGCGCFDDKEHEKLEFWEENGAPAEGQAGYTEYINLRDEVLLDARTVCTARAAALGREFDNCTEALPDTDAIFSNGTSGACKWEKREDEYVGTGTGGFPPTPPPPPRPFDLSGVHCQSGSCNAPRRLIADMLARPEAFLNEHTRIDFSRDGSLVFTDVAPGDIAYLAGLRSGDQLVRINGQAATSLEQVANLLVQLKRARRVTITVKDRRGKHIVRALRVY